MISFIDVEAADGKPTPNADTHQWAIIDGYGDVSRHRFEEIRCLRCGAVVPVADPGEERPPARPYLAMPYTCDESIANDVLEM